MKTLILSESGTHPPLLTGLTVMPRHVLEASPEQGPKVYWIPLEVSPSPLPASYLEPHWISAPVLSRGYTIFFFSQHVAVKHSSSVRPKRDGRGTAPRSRLAIHGLQQPGVRVSGSKAPAAFLQSPSPVADALASREARAATVGPWRTDLMFRVCIRY